MLKKTLAAAGLALLAACTTTPDGAPATGTSPSGTPSTPAPTGKAGAISCADAPEGIVGAALQLNLGHPREKVSGDTVSCEYDGGGANTTVRFRTDSTAESFDQGKRHLGETGLKIKDLPGFHDQAYTGTLGTGEVVQNTVVARKGRIELLVTSGANFEQEKKLVTQLLEPL